MHSVSRYAIRVGDPTALDYGLRCQGVGLWLTGRAEYEPDA
jgi:hypothetical protein